MDITTYFSWGRDLLVWLWQKGWWGKTTAVVAAVIALLVVPAAWWGWSKPPAAAPTATAAATTEAALQTETAADAKRKITGVAQCCSPDGWPTVNQETVRLSHVKPIATTSERGRFRGWITSHGSYFECDSPGDGSYRCLTPQRLDVAQALLLNGATRVVGGDAPFPYSEAEKQAAKMGRGSRQ